VRKQLAQKQPSEEKGDRSSRMNSTNNRKGEEKSKALRRPSSKRKQSKEAGDNAEGAQKKRSYGRVDSKTAEKSGGGKRR